MNDFSSAFRIALGLIGGLDAELRAIILLSLRVSLTASACAFAIGAPLGMALAMYRFRGRGVLVVIANTLLGLPPVVVGRTCCCRGPGRSDRSACCSRRPPW
jgi:tungstate transport system permease protein